MQLKGLIIFNVIFLGSVFLTSEKFVNETNTPKFYFLVISVIIFTGAAALTKNTI